MNLRGRDKLVKYRVIDSFFYLYSIVIIIRKSYKKLLFLLVKCG